MFPTITDVFDIYDLKKFTGDEFQNYLAGLVRSPEWKPGNQFHFYLDIDDDKNAHGDDRSNHSDDRSSHSDDVEKDKNSAVLSITPNKTYSQPGNGYVEFHQLAATVRQDWELLSPWLKKEDFPSQRQAFLQKKLDQFDFSDFTTAVNVLLCFEIARRVETEYYPITLKETENAIDIVMNSPKIQYQPQVRRNRK